MTKDLKFDIKERFFAKLDSEIAWENWPLIGPIFVVCLQNVVYLDNPKILTF